jgi:hypothetical protein
MNIRGLSGMLNAAMQLEAVYARQSEVAPAVAAARRLGSSTGSSVIQP